MANGGTVRPRVRQILFIFLCLCACTCVCVCVCVPGCMRDVYKFETLPLIKQELYRAENKPCGLTLSCTHSGLQKFVVSKKTLRYLISP